MITGNVGSGKVNSLDNDLFYGLYHVSTVASYHTGDIRRWCVNSLETTDFSFVTIFNPY